MKIISLDHLVLTVADISRSIDFYTRILGMEEITFGEGRKALLFGRQKINLYRRGAEVVPHAENAACGTADLCLLTETPLEQVLEELASHGVEAISGIVPRTGAVGAIRSVYCATLTAIFWKSAVTNRSSEIPFSAKKAAS